MQDGVEGVSTPNIICDPWNFRLSKTALESNLPMPKRKRQMCSHIFAPKTPDDSLPSPELEFAWTVLVSRHKAGRCIEVVQVSRAGRSGSKYFLEAYVLNLHVQDAIKSSQT